MLVPCSPLCSFHPTFFPIPAYKSRPFQGTSVLARVRINDKGQREMEVDLKPKPTKKARKVIVFKDEDHEVEKKEISMEKPASLYWEQGPDGRGEWIELHSDDFCTCDDDTQVEKEGQQAEG